MASTENKDGTGLAKRIETWVRPAIREIGAYHVADATGLIKLDAMENPYGLPDAVRRGLIEGLGDVAVNRYPDPEAAGVRKSLAELYGVHSPMDMLFGNGSDELIQILALAVGGPGRVILSVEPAFVMYRMIATFTQSEYVGVPLKSDFSIDLDATLAAIEQHQPALIFLAQPNNPTGNLFDEAALKAIVETAQGLVILDEAYTAFTDSDCLAWASQYENVLVMRTLSKVGLAGLRFGMLFGHRDWIVQLNKVRMPYNINCMTQLAIELALENYPVFAAQCQQLREARTTLFNALVSMDIGTVYPSEANFILVRLAGGLSAPRVHQRMKAAGVLIKNLHGAHPLLENCLRLTVGKPEENQRMLHALQQGVGLTD